MHQARVLGGLEVTSLLSEPELPTLRLAIDLQDIRMRLEEKEKRGTELSCQLDDDGCVE